jgi:hypothetical protein
MRTSTDPVHPEHRLRVEWNSDLEYGDYRLAHTEVVWQEDYTGAVSPAAFLEGFSRIHLRPDENSYVRVEGRYEPRRNLFATTALDLVLGNRQWQTEVGFRQYHDQPARRLRWGVDTKMGESWELAASLEWDLDTGTVREEGYTVRRRLPCDWQLEVTVHREPQYDVGLSLFLTAAPSW